MISLILTSSAFDAKRICSSSETKVHTWHARQLAGGQTAVVSIKKPQFRKESKKRKKPLSEAARDARCRGCRVEAKPHERSLLERHVFERLGEIKYQWTSETQEVFVAGGHGLMSLSLRDRRRGGGRGALR
jgi:hypothetical protein